MLIMCVKLIVRKWRLKVVVKSQRRRHRKLCHRFKSSTFHCQVRHTPQCLCVLTTFYRENYITLHYTKSYL